MNQPEIKLAGTYAEAGTLQEKIIFALNAIGEGPADEVIRKIEALEPEAPNKEVIAVTHRLLTELHTGGLIGGREIEGSIIYFLLAS